MTGASLPPVVPCEGRHWFRAGRCVRCQEPDAWRPSQAAASAVLVPAQVEVSGVDGRYTDPEALQEAAATLLRLAQRLQDVTPARVPVMGS